LPPPFLLGGYGNHVNSDRNTAETALAPSNKKELRKWDLVGEKAKVYGVFVFEVPGGMLLNF
jgi:hypothetical protein